MNTFCVRNFGRNEVLGVYWENNWVIIGAIFIKSEWHFQGGQIFELKYAARAADFRSKFSK